MVRKMGSQVEKMVEYFRHIEQRHHASPTRSSRPSYTELQPMLKDHQPSSPGDLELADLVLDSTVRTNNGSSSGAGGNGPNDAANGHIGGGNGHVDAENGSSGAANGSGGVGNGHVGAANGNGGAGNDHVGAANGSSGTANGNDGVANANGGAGNDHIRAANGNSGTANGNRGTANGNSGTANGNVGTETWLRSKLQPFGSTLKSIGSSISKCFKRGAPPGDDPPHDHGQAISTGMKDWAERVDKALDNPMNMSRLAYFGSMTVFLPILLARPQDAPSSGDHTKKSTNTGYKVEMVIEMNVAFFIHTICLYNVLSYHTVQTTAPRLRRWYERSNSLMWWALSSGWMGVYTAHIPPYCSGWWNWAILSVYLIVVLVISIRVGCQGRVTEEQMLHGSAEWV